PKFFFREPGRVERAEARGRNEGAEAPAVDVGGRGGTSRAGVPGPARTEPNAGCVTDANTTRDDHPGVGPVDRRVVTVSGPDRPRVATARTAPTKPPGPATDYMPGWKVPAAYGRAPATPAPVQAPPARRPIARTAVDPGGNPDVDNPLPPRQPVAARAPTAD